MDLPTRAALVVVVLLAAAVAWRVVSARRGELRGARAPEAADRLPADLADRAGSATTLVQISGEHCSSCARSARVWSEAIAERDGVALIEVDAEDRLDLVRELGVLTTPTTLLYDADGVLRGRVSGAPTARQAAAALSHDQIGADR